ncbi:MAG: hypothetical protein V7L12_22505 [Nostoc sp.]
MVSIQVQCRLTTQQLLVYTFGQRLNLRAVSRSRRRTGLGLKNGGARSSSWRSPLTAPPSSTVDRRLRDPVNSVLSRPDASRVTSQRQRMGRRHRVQEHRIVRLTTGREQDCHRLSLRRSRFSGRPVRRVRDKPPSHRPRRLGSGVPARACSLRRTRMRSYARRPDRRDADTGAPNLAHRLLREDEG